MAKPQTYPRPDFERPNLKWASLNGPWDFLFDDEDVGLTESWQLTGLPAQTKLSPSSQKANSRSASGSVVERIASGTQELLRNNILAEDNAATVIHKRQIQVPFVFQSTASGINDRGVHEVLWYERTVPDLRTPEDKPKGARVLLRFGAVDYEAAVWVNGQYVGGHRGGHVPFQLDVTDAMNVNPGAASAHRVTVRVSDSAYDLTQPRGKQYWGARPESIFYTPSGGIWQNVWVELAPPVRLADSSHGTVLRSDDIQTGKLRGEVSVQGRRAGQHLAVEVEARLEGISVAKSRREELPKDRDLANFEVDVRLSQEQLAELPASVLEGAPASDGRCWREGVALWSPEHPQLYEVTMTLLDSGSGKTLDQVQTQIGMRSLDWSRADGTWRLNGRPYFQALCLDQGYWPDTFMTPPSMDSLKHDIMLAKRMGLNGCRKHQKVEDPAFYYWADKLGYLVWAEMASAYQFSAEYVDRFDQEWTEAVKLAINHPSVVTWTLANESWGYTDLANNVEQRNHIRSLYYKTKFVPCHGASAVGSQADLLRPGPWIRPDASMTTAAGSTSSLI